MKLVYLVVAAVVLVACDVGGAAIKVPPLPPRTNDAGVPIFACLDLASVSCDGTTHLSCRENGEFLQVKKIDCAAKGKVCDPKLICITCSPGSKRCQPCANGDKSCNRNTAQKCDEDGSAWSDIDTCDLPAGDACFDGVCRNLCQVAQEDRSYVGCEFWAADLDNAAIDDLNNASAQQFAVGVANPQLVPVEVKVELNDAPLSSPPDAVEVDSVTIAPGALEIFALPRREVDGSSKNGLNDGTNTAVTSNAYRVSSSHPVIAYQFNPLENVNVFSNDASLLLPTSALGVRYTVVGWPQTIGNSDDPNQDFDPTSSTEDLRAFLTIIGTSASTKVHVKFGKLVVRVVGAGDVPESGPDDEIDVEIGPYDVVNLETAGFNADFTGSIIEADKPVTVFVGSEASDVPIFGTYATRQCCADHLEEQLFPDSVAGSRYIIARMPPRTTALAAAAFADDPLSIAVVNEPEWVRVVAIAPGLTTIQTTLPIPDDVIRLRQGDDAIVRADQDFLLDADKSVAVLQAMASQGVTGIPREYPGGDPSIIAVPPIQQFRRDYVFLTPDKYAFDFVVITAKAESQIELDGLPLPDTCTTSPADGNVRELGDAPPEWVIHRCQLSFPKVTSGANSRVLAGNQNDGVHTIVADREIGIVVYGFDRFVSYAYVGGLDLKIIN